MLSGNQLGRKLKSLEGIPEHFAIRLHRAISWLKAAEANDKDPDVCYVTLWIAFNACYASDLSAEDVLTERERFRAFIGKLTGHDGERRIFNLLWNKYSGPVHSLLQNQYLFRNFWDYHRGQATEWEHAFQRTVTEAHQYLARQDVPALLEIVLDRLYTLRNQVVHGGATYKSKLNRQQLRDGIRMLQFLVPVVLDIMMENNAEDWGPIFYPVIKDT